MPTDDLLAIVSRADELYRQRANPGAIRESVMSLSGARGSNDRYEVQWRLSRALFFLGQEAGTKGAKRQLHSAGVGAGERAVALNGERVEGHFWVGVNLALFAESQGGLRGARAAMWARNELKLAARVNETYHSAGPLRVLGRLEHKAPRWLGGNRNRSRERFDRALEIAPGNSVTLLYAAELAMDQRDSARAAALLKQIIESPIDPEWEFENCRDKKQAGEFLQTLSRA
jgi:TRAP transporter TatT component family protein